MNEIEDIYPEYFFRGITEQGKINLEYKRVLGDVFRFDDRYKNEEGYAEASINWDDDKGALENLKKQKRGETESLKYENGIIKIQTKKIKEMRNRYKGKFSYERKPVEGNKYHGNVLLRIDEIAKPWRKLISDELAMNVEVIYTYNKENNNWDENKTEVQ